MINSLIMAGFSVLGFAIGRILESKNFTCTAALIDGASIAVLIFALSFIFVDCIK